MSLKRIASATALATGAAAAPLAGVVYSPCVEYISSRFDEAPVAGELIGWEEITLSWGHGFTETSFTGYYQTDAGVIKVDCETYRQVA